MSKIVVGADSLYERKNSSFSGFGDSAMISVFYSLLDDFEVEVAIGRCVDDRDEVSPLFRLEEGFRERLVKRWLPTGAISHVCGQPLDTWPLKCQEFDE